MIHQIILVLVILIFTACTSNNNQVKPNPKCFEKPKTGMCKALFYKYYFNEKDGKCKKFVWGGCRGNVPFHNLNECKSSCEN